MKELRTRRLMDSDQRMVIVAMDHAGFMGPLPGLENPGQTLDILASTGIDAVLTTMGVASTFSGHLNHLGLILRVDGGSSMRNPKPSTIEKLYTAEDAVRLGADAIICMGMIGFPEEASSLKNLTELVAESKEWNIPLIAEMLVKAKDAPEPTVDDISFAVRVGIELGADIIKTNYAKPIDQYKRMISQCYRPVVVLGGSKVDDVTSLFESVAEAIQAGASGVAIGRNVWQNSNPTGVCRALVSLVHEGISVGRALEEMSH